MLVVHGLDPMTSRWRIYLSTSARIIHGGKGHDGPIRVYQTALRYVESPSSNASQEKTSGFEATNWRAAFTARSYVRLHAHYADEGSIQMSFSYTRLCDSIRLIIAHRTITYTLSKWPVISTVSRGFPIDCNASFTDTPCMRVCIVTWLKFR